MEWYISWVKANPIVSAMIQFAILGTLGEFISHLMRTKSAKNFASIKVILGKVVAWAILGIIIKYGFAGMKGFTNALLDKHMLPAFLGIGIGKAFAISTLTNIFFGPQMMFFHRVEDNIIDGKWSWQGMPFAIKTLVWFWIPAHTVTFALPVHFQIGLAAVWGLVLGIILGIAKGKKKAAEESA